MIPLELAALGMVLSLVAGMFIGVGMVLRTKDDQ